MRFNRPNFDDSKLKLKLFILNLSAYKNIIPNGYMESFMSVY